MPLATRLVPTRTSSATLGEGVDDARGGALALDDVTVEAPDTRSSGKRTRSSCSTRSVPPPR